MVRRALSLCAPNNIYRISKKQYIELRLYTGSTVNVQFVHGRTWRPSPNVVGPSFEREPAVEGDGCPPTGIMYYAFCRLYPFSPQPLRQCLAPTCHLSSLN